MKRWQDILLGLGWALALLVPILYVCAWAIESVFEVPLAPESFRFERPWAALLLVSAPLVWLARVLLRDATPRIQVSRAKDLAAIARPKMRQWIAPATVGARIVAALLLSVALYAPAALALPRSNAAALCVDDRQQIDVASVQFSRIVSATAP